MNLIQQLRRDEYLEFREKNLEEFRRSKWEVLSLFRRNHWSPTLEASLDSVKELNKNGFDVNATNERYDLVVIDDGEELRVTKGSLTIKSLGLDDLEAYSKEYSFSFDKQMYYNNFTFLTAKEVKVGKGLRVKLVVFLDSYGSFKRKLYLEGDNVIDIEIRGGSALSSEHWMFEVREGEQASVSILQDVASGERLAMFDAIVNEDSTLNLLASDLGGNNSKTRVNGFLKGHDSSLREVLVSFVGSRVMDVLSTLYHSGSHTQGLLILKGVVEDKGILYSKGLIKVFKGASRSKTRLVDEALVIGNGKVNSIPSLEVEDLNVEASHASFISHLDDEKVYYLLTRGLRRGLAEDLIVLGFIDEKLREFSKHEEFRLKTLTGVMERLKGKA